MVFIILIFLSLLSVGNCLIPRSWTIPSYYSRGGRSGQARECLAKNNLKELRYSIRVQDTEMQAIVFPPSAYSDGTPSKGGLVAPLLTRREAPTFWFNVCEHQRKACLSTTTQGTKPALRPSQSPNGDTSYLVCVQESFFRRH